MYQPLLLAELASCAMRSTSGPPQCRLSMGRQPQFGFSGIFRSSHVFYQLRKACLLFTGRSIILFIGLVQIILGSKLTFQLVPTRHMAAHTVAIGSFSAQLQLLHAILLPSLRGQAPHFRSFGDLDVISLPNLLLHLHSCPCLFFWRQNPKKAQCLFFWLPPLLSHYHLKLGWQSLLKL